MKFLLAILFLITTLYSCSEYKKFTLYKQKPIDDTSVSLIINRTFIIDPKTKNEYSPLEKLFFLQNGMLFFQKGHYIIRGNEIFIEYFDSQVGGSFKKYIDTFSGKILNDSTIIIEKNYCKYCYMNFAGYRNSPEIIFNPPLKFILDSDIIKPYIPEVWFLKKNWYKKNVWYNNQ